MVSFESCFDFRVRDRLPKHLRDINRPSAIASAFQIRRGASGTTSTLRSLLSKNEKMDYRFSERIPRVILLEDRGEEYV